MKGLVVAVAGVGAVLSGLVGWYTTYKTVATATAPAASGAAAPVPAVNPLSILVLPFANQTGDAGKAYIADAMATSISADLLRIRDAFVTPAATAFAYKDKPLTAQQVGKDAGVRFVLQGGVLASGERLRISAQLADTQSGAQLWSETFEGDLADLFALQDQVTTRIGNSIGREMVIVAARDSERRKNTPKAADLLLRARALGVKPRTLENARQIEALYREVLALEPGNAGAMASLAASLVVTAYNFVAQLPPEQQQKMYEESHSWAEKSRALDPDNPAIYVSQGLYAWHHDDYDGLLRAAQTRAALEPKSPTALNNLADAYLNGGEPQKALEALNRALALDPRHPSDTMLINIAMAHFQQRNFDAAIEWAQKFIDLNPRSGAQGLVAMAYAMKGDDAKAQAAAAQLRQQSPGFRVMDRIKPPPSAPAAAKAQYEQLLLPAARKAGLLDTS